MFDNLVMSDGMLNLILAILVSVGMFMFIKYNVYVLALFGKLVHAITMLINKLVGRKLRHVNKSLERDSTLKQSSLRAKMFNYYDKIVDDLGLKDENVSVVGLMTFIILLALAMTIAVSILFAMNGIILLAAFGASIFLVTIVFKFKSASKVERKQAAVMDVVDLLVSDISGGVFNAILRYRAGFNPEVKPYFDEFVDNIQTKGFSFSQAMAILRGKLGRTFYDFAHKAILFEASADENMEDIFAPIIDFNRHKRTLKARNDSKFATQRSVFLISTALVLLFAVFTLFHEPAIYTFFTDTPWGKLLMIGDVLLVAFVLNYITALKTQNM